MSEPDYAGVAALLRVIVDAGRFDVYGQEILEKVGIKNPLVSMCDAIEHCVDSGMFSEIHGKEMMIKWTDDWLASQWPDKFRGAEFKDFDPEDVEIIYFIQRGTTGPIKIGISADVGSRLAALQTASHEPLTVIGTMRGSYKLESSLHQLFSRFRIRGEWFSPAEEILTYIADNCGSIGAGA